MIHKSPTPILILAAGASKRLGQSKQLLDIEGVTLIERAVRIAQSSSCQPIIAILGASAPAIQKTIQDYSITTLLNNDWYEGMGSSLRLGMEFIKQEFSEVEQIICLVSDQPFLNAKHIEQLLAQAAQSEASIITTSYLGRQGVPTLFKKNVFEELLQVQGDKGARFIIRKDPSRVFSIQNEQLGIDIDTMDDYERVLEILSNT